MKKQQARLKKLSKKITLSIVVQVLMALMFLFCFVFVVYYSMIGVRISLATQSLDSSLTYSVFALFGTLMIGNKFFDYLTKYTDSKYNSPQGTSQAIETLPADIANKLLDKKLEEAAQHIEHGGEEG